LRLELRYAVRLNAANALMSPRHVPDECTELYKLSGRRLSRDLFAGWPKPIQLSGDAALLHHRVEGDPEIEIKGAQFIQNMRM